MKRRHTSSVWAVWLFAAALLLKAAMPMLASASAGVQGKPLVEVCTVYGMAMVAAAGDKNSLADTGQVPKPDDISRHLDHQCALGALAAFFTEAPAAFRLPGVPQRLAARLLDKPPHQVPDAAAAWVAGLKHGPPTRS